MKINSLEIKDFHPIKNLKLENLGSTVIIAGANGSGKTRLKSAIVQTLQGSVPLMDMSLGATREEEEPEYFAGKTLEVKNGVGNQVLGKYINSRRSPGAEFVGSLVNIDSNRTVQSLNYAPVNRLAEDPDVAGTATNFYSIPFAMRWQDFMNYIHQKCASIDKKIVDEVKKNPQKKGEEIIKNYPNPLEKYKKIFRTLLPGKELQDVDTETPKEFYYTSNLGELLPFNSLSSGEQEVVRVVFDVMRKEIKHSVIIVDEPELHLHPTLAFKLIETLKTIGDGSNQFIFLTHSADLISTYYSTGDVYFIDTIQTGENQGRKLSDLSHNHKEVVQLIGQNLGLFAVGKKLIFVEGEDSSIDRLAYHKIAQTVIPDAKVISVGSVANINMLNAIEKQIRKSIFGIDIFMIRDRDGLDDNKIKEIEQNGRLRCLKKRHLENYFLDSEILFKVANKLYLMTVKPSLTKELIETETKKIAESTINFNLRQNTKDYLALRHSFKIPTVKEWGTKKIADVKAKIISGVKESLGTLSPDLHAATSLKWLDNEELRLNDLLKTDGWKNEFQGKIIFTKLCRDILNEDPLKVRQAYIDVALAEKSVVFDDIISIFKSFLESGTNR